MPDEFDWETGLFSGIGTVAEEWFAVGEGGGNTNLYLKLVGPDGEEGEPRYGTGSDWASFDGGETVEHPQGGEKNRRYHQNTAIAQLFRAAFEAGAEEVLRKRSANLGGKGPSTAKLWHGLRFRWEVKTERISMKDRQTGEQIERDISRVLPVEFLGEGDAPVIPIQGQSQDQPEAAQTQPAAAPAQDNGDPLSGLSVEDTAKAKVLAKTLPYHEWVDKIMELPNAVASDSLMAALGDEALYTTLKEG